MVKLLIVEDDLLLDEAYRNKFEEKYDLKIATDGESGVRTARSFKPDMILLDIYLPGNLNGLDVLKELKKSRDTANIPVLVITNLPDAIERVIEMGATKCLMKTDVGLNDIESELMKMESQKGG